MVHLPTVLLLLRCPSRNAFTWLARASFRLRRGELIRRIGDHSAVVCAERLRSIGVDINILDAHSHLVRPNGWVAVYVHCCVVGFPVWGVGISRDAATASLHAVLSAVGRGCWVAGSGIPADAAPGRTRLGA